jgi:hypothetical protein
LHRGAFRLAWEKMFKPGDLFDLKHTRHGAIFDKCQYGWDALKKIKEYMAANLKRQHFIILAKAALK